MIIYIKGDATYPDTSGNKIIAHVCNDIGAWGRGFVLALSKRWKAPEEAYKSLFKGLRVARGTVQYVQVEGDIEVANMVAMEGLYHSEKNPNPLKMPALIICLEDLYEQASLKAATIHMPKIGSGLAKGNWSEIEEVLIRKSSLWKVKTYIYSLD